MVHENSTVLIVDDEQVICDILLDELSDQGFLCTTTFDSNDALKELSKHHFELVLLDIRLPGMSGMEILTKIRANHPNTATIMITAINNIDTAVEAMKLGALDYIVKPFNLDRVNASIRTVLETKKHLPERGDSRTVLCAGGEEKDRQAMEKPFSQMNAIAYGVEARYDLLLGRSKIVTQETVAIAWRLDVPDKEIRRWATARAKLDSEKERSIDSSVEKLKRSPLAQIMLGVAAPYLLRTKPDESHN